MEAEQVIDKILSDANAQAKKTADQAKEKLDSEQANHDAGLAEYKEQTVAIAKEAAQDEKSHILAGGRMEIAKEYLAEKRKILDQVFDNARGQIQNLPDEEYRKLMTRLMLEAVETGDEEVVVDKNETRIDLEFMKEVNRKLGPGFQGNLRLAGENQDIKGGFILKRGKIKTNVSIDVLLDQAGKDLEIKLAAEIFG